MARWVNPPSQFSEIDVRSLFPKALSKQMTEIYMATPINETPRKSMSSDDDEKETTTFLHGVTSNSDANTRLLMQCFLWIVLSTIFIFAMTTTIVISGTAKCRNYQHSEGAAVPTETLDPVLAHQKALSTFPNPKNTPKDAKNCGPNAAAAIAKGCHLDMISFTWLPHECYDADLSAEFIELKDWTWALDSNGTVQVTQEQILAGEINNGWVTFEYHLTHCLYTWKKLVRHLERGGAMDWYVMAYDHTRHCSKLLLQEDVDRDDFNSEFFVQYPMCGYA